MLSCSYSCLLCEPGWLLLRLRTQLGKETPQNNKNQEKGVAKGFWLVLCILSAFVCRDKIKENWISVHELMNYLLGSLKPYAYDMTEIEIYDPI